MNNLRVRFSLICIYLIILSLVSCHLQDGNRGTSLNIQDSKEREVFIREYFTATNPIIINDTIQLDIIEAWLEYQWWHSSKSKNNTMKSSDYHIRINTSQELPNGFNFEWSIGKPSSGLYLRSSSKNGLIGDFKKRPPNTIAYPVIKGRLSKRDSLTEERVIGKLTLIAK